MPAVVLVEEEAGEEEVLGVDVSVTACTESSGSVDVTTAIVAEFESLHERSTSK